MQKFLKAILVLACAFAVTIMTGCINNNDKEIIVRIYDVTNDCDIEKNVVIQNDVTIQEVVDSYIALYVNYVSNGDGELLIGFEDDIPQINAKLDGDVAILTFSKVLANMGVQAEIKFIDNLSYTITKNIPEIKGIHINVNGEAYASGHLYYEIDELISINDEQNK